MEDKFKSCVTCGNRMYVIYSYDECYRHRVCNMSFPCDMCKNWDNEKGVTAIIDHMLDKVRQKAVSFL